MSSYLDLIEQNRQTVGAKQEWSAINAEYAARMQLQNRFKTGLGHCPVHRRHHAPRHG
jgi:isocitrate lyase